jgi:hypothetical protein
MCFKKQCYLIALFFAVILTSCKKWDDSKVNNPDLTQSLTAAIAADPTLTKFSDYMSKTGVDVLLQSSKTFTVWAPNNDALQSLDPAIVSDTAKLRNFLLNHISYETYFKRDVQTSLRVPMLNGKFNNFYGNKFEDANVVAADKFVSNGVLHVIDKAILVLPNMWDFINSTASQYVQNSFVAALNFTAFDPSLATIDSISSSTGRPVYHPGTGFVVRNSFNDRVFDLRREDKQYTYFVISNAGFTLKADSLKPYYKATSATTTDSLDKWNLAKDLVVDTLYPTAASLPSTITSKFGIVIPINKASIVDTKKVSNGIVYVLSTSDIVTASRFKEIRVEGENPSGFQSDKTSNTNFLRVRMDRPDTTKTYSDLMVSGHGITDYYSFYRLNEMPSMKYNVYGRAINDFQTQVVYESLAPYYFTAPSTYTQIAAQPVFAPTTPRTPQQLWYPVPGVRGVAPLPTFYTFTAPSFAAVSVSSPAAAYNEIFLGSFTSSLYGTLDIRLMSGPTATAPALPTFGNTGNGPIVLDYFRLVPAP